MESRTSYFSLGAVVVLPAVDSAIDADDPIRTGDVLIVGDGVTMTPPAGWSLDDGIRATDRPRAFDAGSAEARLHSGGIEVTTRAGRWQGSARALVRQVVADSRRAPGSGSLRIRGAQRTVPIQAGRPAVSQGYTTAAGAGTVVGLAGDGAGLTVVISGDRDELGRRAPELSRMIASLRVSGSGS